MQTVSSLAERLDMSPEAALEKLRYMFFEVEGVESVLSDEQCDLLIDADDDPSVAEKYREKILKEREKIEKRNERLRKAAADRKTKAAAKKKTAAKKAPAKKTAKSKTAAAAEDEEADVEAPDDEAHEEPHHPVAEILPPRPAEEEHAEAVPVEVQEPAAEEVKPKKAKAPAKKAPRKEAPKAEKAVPGILIGAAVDKAADTVQILRADGTLVDVSEVEAVEEPPEVLATFDDEPETGLLAEAELQQEEEERRKAREAARSHVRPDPAVVAEVKRRAEERKQKMLQQRAGAPPAPTVHQRKGPTGKTARKRQKRAEKMRDEEAKRRQAAATVREIEAAGPGKRRRPVRRSRGDDAVGAAVDQVFEDRIIEIEDSITVEELADAFGESVNDIILALMDQDVMVTKNDALDLAVVRALAEERGFEVRSVIPGEDEILAEEPDDPADLLTRAPVVTVMGHVDHGKTSLLDRVRTANVAEGEVGGITQHIAAYDVPIGNGRVVFLDTPGHAAFTQMRARGAQVTDLVVLVVAADDGVMPQTVEAIDHARAAEVPIVVAVNKCDKPDAQPDRIRQELVRYELVDESWGGKTVIKNISAKTGDGVDELMELLSLESEMLELKGNPKKRARGAVVESEITQGQGPVAWVLIQNGTLRVGDAFLAGTSYGRVRAMISSRGEHLQEAGPSTPVLVLGFNGLPNAGDAFVVVQEERAARVIAEKRASHARLKQGTVKHITLEDFHARLLAGEKQELNVVLKADVQGSVDVLQSSLAKLGNEEVRVKLVRAGVGGINESDVLLASASDAVIIGFHVTANPRVQKLAEQEGVDIRTYRIIYEVSEEVRKALEGMLAPESREVVTGHAEVRQVFRSSAIGNIAGCFVQDGEVGRGHSARVVRDDVVVYDGKIGSLKRNKDDARSVAAGFECGIVLENFLDVKAGDIIETYRMEQVAKTLA